MPRRSRPLAPGLTYHLTARGNERRAIFRDAADRLLFLHVLGAVAGELSWTVESYCLMPNHVHVLLRTPSPDLSIGMHRVLGPYARRFNDRHDRVGHLFEKRFDSRVIRDDAHHAEVFRYIALNPVRAKLCARARDFRWSAHAALVGTAPAPGWLDAALSAFGGDRERYASFVEAGTATYLQDLLGDGSNRRLAIAVDAGFSQVEIARALSVSQRTVSRRLGG